jgi:molecular chaperone GrpE
LKRDEQPEFDDMQVNSKPEPLTEELEANRELPAAGEPAKGSTAEPAGGQETKPSGRDELLDRAARLQAEFENARKRSAKELQEHKEFALEDALKSLLPALDSFDRALHAPAKDVEEFRSGVGLIRKQLHDALEKLGLRPIPAKGEPFDPLLHEAVEVVDTTGTPDNHVLEELQPGYKLRHRLLRPAGVRVARNQENPSHPGEQ